MLDQNDVATGNAISPTEWNAIAEEIQTAAKRAGFVLSGADLEQLAAAAVDLACASDWYRDVGAANAYVLQRVAPRPALSQLVAATDGATVRFRPSATNTGATTVKVGDLAAKDLRDQAGVALTGGELSPMRDVKIRYNQGTDQYYLAPAPAGGVISYVSVPIPADLTNLPSAIETIFTWDYSARNESEDWFDGVTIDTTDLVVPAGVTRISVSPQINWASTTATDNSRFQLRLFKNGSSTGFGPHSLTTQDTRHGPQNRAFFQRPFWPDLEVAMGDIITLRHRHDTGGNQDITAAQTYINIFGFA